jgi:hypothetical protein
MVYVAGRVLLAAEGAQAARGDANVGVVDVPVDVEVGDVAVHALAHVIGQPADRQNVAGAVERNAVVEAEALPRVHPGAIGRSAASSVWKPCRARAADCELRSVISTSF